LFYFERDLFIPEIDLWIDSKRVKPFGFISHGHTDHIARHKKILCSEPTAEFVKKRVKSTSFHTLKFGEEHPIGDYRISLHPAGHILGSAQIRILKNGQSLLYTGDFRLGNSRTVESFEYVPSDILIMETTFGKSQYRMPPREQVEDELIELCASLLKQNKTPVIFAYSLGKGQEALKILSDAGLPVAVDEAIERYVSVYKENGVSFGHYETFDRYDFQGRVLLLPVNFRFQKFFKNLFNGYTIYLSGWGMDQWAENRFRVDKVLPLSDHADYYQLFELVEKLKPKEIYCTHGFPQFVQELKAAGYQAKTLENSSQSELDL